MVDFKKLGVTQKIMADLTGVNPATISKIVGSGDYTPLDLNISRNIRYTIADTRDIIKKTPSKFSRELKRNIAFYNFKGGVGKTTLCYQISTHLALMGFNVLVVDTDPQGHLSTSLGFNTDDNFLTLYDVIIGKIPVDEVIQKIYLGLDCIPSNISLSRLEPALNNERSEDNKLYSTLSSKKYKYDFIIFDTNPTISRINRDVILFSDMLCVAVETQAYALNGLKILLADLDKFCKESSIEAPQIVIIPNKYEERTASSGEAMAVLRDFYGDYVIPNFAVRKSEELHNSGKTGQPLAFFCRSNSIALEDIKDVLFYLLNHPSKLSAAADL
jgi:chromosome partitioning protein